MKKFMKKAMSIIAGAAMAFTMVVVPSVKAEAAEGSDNGKYYVIGTMNGWSTSEPSAMDKNGTVYTYEYNLDSAGNVEFKIIEQPGNDWNSVGYQVNNNGGNFTKAAGQSGTVKITFDTSLLSVDKWWDGSSAVTISGTAFDVEVVPNDVYYVKGNLATTDWDPSSEAGLMTANGNIHSITFEDITKDTEVLYKVLHDPAQFEWTAAYTEASNGSKTDANGTHTMSVDGDLTISIDCTTNVVTVTEIPATQDDDTTGDDTTGDETEKNPSEDTSDVETDSVVNITEDEIKELEDAVVVEGAEDKLVISVVPENSEDLDVIAAALADVLKDVKYVVVDLKFESGNQPEEGTKITLPVSKIASVKDTAYVSVYRVDADELKLIEVVKVTDGNITFEPDHFSTYVFAEANEAEYNEYVNDQDAGVSLPIVALIAVAALAGGCVVFSSKRKHA